MLKKNSVLKGLSLFEKEKEKRTKKKRTCTVFPKH